MFALRTKTGIKPMFVNELETFAFGHRFANDCCQKDEHKVRPTIRIIKYLLRYTRKFMIAYLTYSLTLGWGN
jgi:hypothetical protein